MISKELLSEVLGLKRIDEIYIEDSVLYFCELNNGINIYELAHKCKEWAYKEGFIIDTGFHKYYINQFKANCYGWVSSNINIKQHFNECTEQEAIFKACQWILDNKED